MPTIAPIHDAGEVGELFSYNFIWSSLGGLRVLAAPDEDACSFAGLDIQGETVDPVLAGEDVQGETLNPARSSLDTGAVMLDTGYGSIDAGLYSPADPALGSLGVAGESFFAAFASSIVRNNPSLTGQFLYLALASLQTASGFYDAAEGASSIRGRIARPSRSSVAVKELGDAASGGTLETGSQAGYPALSSLDTGTESGAVSPASVDAQDGEGIDFIVDIQDEILATGGGSL